MIKMEKDTIIDVEMITKLRERVACPKALDWLRAKPRTWGQAIKRHPSWCAWAFIHMKELEVTLEGLSSHDRSWAIVRREDCPVNPEGLSPYDRARVMVARKDCPVDLEGLSSYERAWAREKRGLPND